MNLQKIILLIILQVIEFLIFVFRILHINIKSFSHPRWFASQSIFGAKLLIYLLYKYASKIPRLASRWWWEDDLLIIIKFKLFNISKNWDLNFKKLVSVKF